MQALVQIAMWVAYVLVAILFILLMGLLTYRNILRYTTRIQTPDGISSLEEITLGGAKQWIFIRGTDQNNPVLLFLHGGPGEPAMGMPSSRRLDAELIKHFTVIHWDQRGTGKSYQPDIPTSSMSFDRWVEDCIELIDHARARFGAQKVFLVGHSGGTLLGLRVAHRYPEKVHAYVGVSQIVGDHEQQRLSYEFILEEAKKLGDPKRESAIRALGPPPYESPAKTFEKAGYIVRYGGFIHANLVRHMAFVALSYLTSPEYSLQDAFLTITRRGLKFTMESRWEEIQAIDFTTEIRSIGAPIYFFIGRHDMIAPAILVESFYSGLEAEKGKRLVFFEHSAHMPIVEENEKYQGLLVDVVLKDN